MAIHKLAGPRIILRCWLIAVREQVPGVACIHEALEESRKGQVVLKGEKPRRPSVQAGIQACMV